MQTETTQASSAPELVASESLRRPSHFLEAEADSLLATLRLYVRRGGLVHGEGVQEEAVDLLTEVVVEAIEHADRFDPSRSPMAWLLGIAANLVRRKQAERVRRARREPLLRDCPRAGEEALSDDDLLERLGALSVPGPEQEVIADANARALLALVSPEDARVLRLAVIYELSGEDVAQELGITPGAARVRVHRARTRLREAWLRRQGTVEGERDEDPART